MLGMPERRNILFTLFYYVGLKGLDSSRGHGSFEGKGILGWEKLGQCRGQDMGGHWGGALCAAARVVHWPPHPAGDGVA